MKMMNERSVAPKMMAMSAAAAKNLEALFCRQFCGALAFMSTKMLTLIRIDSCFYLTSTQR